MGKYYHIYECKGCNRSWGTEKGDGTQPRACDDCQQFCRPVESREMIHNYFKCGCGADWTSKNANSTKCKKCGRRVNCSRPDPKGKFGKSFADPSTEACKAKHWARMMEERERSQQQQQRQFSSHQNLSSFPNHFTSGDSRNDTRPQKLQSFSNNGASGDSRNDARLQNLCSFGNDVASGDSHHSRRPSEGTSRQQTKNWDELKQAEADRLFDLGNRHHIDGNYELAVEKYTEAIGLSPSHMEAYYKNRSRANMKLNKFEEAEKDLLQSLQTMKIATADDAPVSTRHDLRAHESSASSRSNALNVRVMQALYDNDFEPVHLGKILGSNADNATIKAMISKEMPSALASKPMIKFDPSSGYCSIVKIDEVCQKDGWKYSVCRGECNRWHLCKKWILGNCEFGLKCERIHDFFHSRNTKLLEKNNLYGVDPMILRALFLSQHRPQCMRPAICHRYHTSKCYDSKTCTYIHICINFQNQCKCSASHDLFSDHNRKVLEYCNVSMNGRCSKEKITKRIALWNPMVVPPIKMQKASACNLKMEEKKATITPPGKKSATPATKTQKVSPLKPQQPESPCDKTTNQSRNTHLQKRMALECPEEKSEVALVRSNDFRPDISGTVREIRAEQPSLIDKTVATDIVDVLRGDANHMKSIADITNNVKIDSDTAGAASVSKWIPVWQYNPGKRGWKNFPEGRQAELEAAICDVETEVKKVFIEGKAVGVNMDYMSVDEYTETGGVEVRRMFARDKWKWYLGNKAFNQWSEITGEGGADVQGQIERAFKNYKSTDSEPTKRMRISNGQVLLDFEEWIVRGGPYLDLRRRPDPN